MPFVSWQMRLRGGGKSKCCAILESGKRMGKVCGRAGKDFGDGKCYCGNHIRAARAIERVAEMKRMLLKLKEGRSAVANR